MLTLSYSGDLVAVVGFDVVCCNLTHYRLQPLRRNGSSPSALAIYPPPLPLFTSIPHFFATFLQAHFPLWSQLGF